MLICHCRGVSDRAIRNAIRRGAKTPREVAAACGAGTSCGGCRPAVTQIVRGELAEREADAPVPGGGDSNHQINT